MPLYLVRWPTFDISLVQARDEHDLWNTLDEIGDPSTCRWKIYKGPLHLGFKLNLDFKDQTNYKFVPAKPKAKILNADKLLTSKPKFDFLKGGDSETHDQMWDSFIKFCFPELWKYDVHLCHEFESCSLAEKAKQIEGVESAAVKELSVFFGSAENDEGRFERMKRRTENENN